MRQPIRIARRFQGPTGLGQGGWTAHRFASGIDALVDVSIDAPIPLETDLFVASMPDGARWRLQEDVGAPDQPRVIMTASRRRSLDVTTPPVSIEHAVAARRRFGFTGDDHPVPHCFSCGLGPDSMCVHPAALNDGSDRYATDWTVPAWAVAADGDVDEGVVWAALDCTAAWYAGNSRGRRTAFTVRFAIDVLGRFEVGEKYVLVGWSGDADDGWDGRKRAAASAVFTADGTCLARSTSLWVSVDD